MAKLSLAEQLRAKGFVSEKQIAEHQAQTTLDLHEQETSQNKKGITTNAVTHSWHQLDVAPTMGDFRKIAKIILEDDPMAIHRVIAKAHRFKDETQDENKKFIWFFYALRDSLTAMPAARDFVIRRAFRRHNPDPVTRSINDQ